MLERVHGAIFGGANGACCGPLRLFFAIRGWWPGGVMSGHIFSFYGRSIVRFDVTRGCEKRKCEHVVIETRQDLNFKLELGGGLGR